MGLKKTKKMAHGDKRVSEILAAGMLERALAKSSLALPANL